MSAVIASLQIYFWSNSKCLGDSWRPLLMSVSVAANGVLQFPLLIRCISFKWKFVKFTQSLISTIPRFLHNSTSIAHKFVNYKVHFGSKQAWYVPCWMKLRSKWCWCMTKHVDQFRVGFVLVLASHLLKRFNLEVTDHRSISRIDGYVGKTRNIKVFLVRQKRKKELLINKV